ncbi:phosphatidate cytidylyltransferase [Haloplanus halobius]|uniref:phosphatidate cytidylyltransferase n=1 Tax=Haloplanus halobius TaxID=2934938 RepID=UPI0020106BF9|nr:phosphatidate cytidylyltransferase [Haloplanus sp. XH21]
MPPSRSLRDRINLYRGTVTVVFLLVIGGFVFGIERQIPPSLALLFGMTFVFLLGSTLNTVRAHPLYRPLSAVYTTLLFGIAYVSTGFETTFLLALMGLSILEVVVEAYNYLHGTSYLRLDFMGENTSQQLDS